MLDIQVNGDKNLMAYGSNVEESEFFEKGGV